MTVQHSALTGAELHEPKGAAAASANTVYVATGAGSGAWTSFTTWLLATIAATPTEIARWCDVSARLISGGSTLSATEAAHDGKVVLLNSLTGSVVTLPAATGSGAKILFKVSVLATSNSHIVKVANASDIIQGVILTVDTDTAGTVTGWASGASDDTITLNRSTSGSTMRGEWIELLDTLTNVWTVRGCLACTGSAVTPFSATV